jgi:UDP-glucose 4-epimerase
MISRALVTGGAGFIGSHVVDSLLADGVAVSVVDDLSSGDAARVAPEADLKTFSIVDQAQLDSLVDAIRPEGDLPSRRAEQRDRLGHRSGP